MPELGWPRSGFFPTGSDRLWGSSGGRITLPPMNNLIFQLCVSAVAGWVNRGQQQVIEYLLEENRGLREQLGGRRLRLWGESFRQV